MFDNTSFDESSNLPRQPDFQEAAGETSEAPAPNGQFPGTTADGAASNDLRPAEKNRRRPKSTAKAGPKASTRTSPENTLHGHNGEIVALAFSPNGEHVASASVGEPVQLWELSSGENTSFEETKVQKAWPVTSVCFTGDNRAVAVATSGKRRATYANAASSVGLIGPAQVTRDICCHVYFHHVYGGRIVRPNTTDDLFRGSGKLVSFPSTSQIAVLAEYAYIFDAESGEIRNGKGQRFTAAVSMPDGKRLVTGDAAGHVLLWDSGWKSQALTDSFRSEVTALAVSEDSKWIAAAIYGEPSGVCVFDAKKKKVRQSWETVGECKSLTFLPDNGDLVSFTLVHQEGIVHRRSLTSDQCKGWKPKNDVLTAAAVSVNGVFIALGFKSGKIEIWSMDDLPLA